MSVSRHHADWLFLVEVSGPFVSLPVLMRVFPQGLEPRDPAQAKSLRAAYAEWQDNPTAPGKQRAWVMHVLTAPRALRRNKDCRIPGPERNRSRLPQSTPMLAPRSTSGTQPPCCAVTETGFTKEISK